ncbi:MAG: hypothetical protein PW999_16780 [Paraburkholderia tropica]|nr:hypothetical protein [Paraburkholderia tropica]
MDKTPGCIAKAIGLVTTGLTGYRVGRAAGIRPPTLSPETIAIVSRFGNRKTG